MKKRVLLGMSGGVDSSVSAILLQEQGYEVIGVTMKLLDSEIEGSCCNISSTMDAKRVCDALNIPHYTLNFVEEFKEHVINNFIECYKNCKTPNPCIECNRYLKFGVMYKKAMELNCDYIATGHYAKIEYSKKYKKNVLKIANAKNKDQSYVLYNMPNYILDKLLLPLGNFNSKDEIREIAKKYNLLVANKPDSEDICFVTNGDYKSYLENNSDIKENIGNIIDKEGNILGKHTGLYKYTIGQRKGLKISSKTPLYVIGFNKSKNELIVGLENELYSKEFYIDDVNWLLFDKLEKTIDAFVKIRYKSDFYKCKIMPLNNKIKVVFETPQKSVTKGQSAVFYIDDIVIGGGKII